VLAFSAMSIAVLGRLFQVQVIQGSALSAQAVAQHTASITLHGSRGFILDRNGRVLVSNRQVFDVFADPSLVNPSQRHSYAANLLGFVDADKQGQYGIEQYYNEELNGSDGHESSLVDLLGNSIVLGGEHNVPARDGVNLQLGLDSQIQYWAELALAHGVQ